MECEHPQSASSYSYRLGCRCERCRGWNRSKQRGVCDRALAVATPNHTGCLFPRKTRLTAYQYGCRCDACKAANTKRSKLYRLAKKETPPDLSGGVDVSEGQGQ